MKAVKPLVGMGTELVVGTTKGVVTAITKEYVTLTTAKGGQLNFSFKAVEKSVF